MILSDPGRNGKGAIDWTGKPLNNKAMTRWLACSFLFVVLAGSVASAGLLNEAKATVKKSRLNWDQFGILVATGEKEKLLEHRSGELMIPASVTKLITAAAVLQHFPPGTRFKTQIYTEGSVDKGTLKGNLYLKGGGDPSFVSETLWVLVNNFLRSGIQKIEGDIVVDDTLFDRLRFDPSRQSVRVDRAYDAPTGAMSFNWNSINIYVRPGKKAGDKAEVFLDPENGYTRLVNKVKTAAKGKRTSLIADRIDDPKRAGDTIKVSGVIGLGAKEQVIYKNITEPDLWSGHNLKSFLAQRGVQHKGAVRAGATPSSASLAAEVESKPIEHIIADMNKFSNNYVAEMLTKQLATTRSKPGSIATGMEVIADYLKSLGLGKGDFVLTNPSGFTRDNRLSALALWKVLRAVENQFPHAPEFLVALPIAGVDGTMKRRLRETVGERAVRAKTGLLNGVVSLAGYLSLKDGKVVPFVFLYNGNADDFSVRQTVDQMLVRILTTP